ncbi:hypothetical protein ACLOJK_002270 [Asimina triloba]
MQSRTLVSAIDKCLSIAQFKQILGQALVAGLWRHHSFLMARLVAYCATTNSGDHLTYAHLIFDRLENPSPFSYNALIRGYSQTNTPLQSLRLFYAMLQNGIYPDKYTFPFVLKACARASCLPQAIQLHSMIVKCGLGSDLHVQTSLLHTYASFRCTERSKRVFDEMPQRSTVTWNAIISCCPKSSDDVGCFVLFGEMLKEGVEVNDDTLVSMLCSCANSGALLLGRSVHGFVVRKHGRLSMGVELGTSLVHMYGKCGRLGGGIQVFEAMDVRDVSAWTAMIGGLAMCGCGMEAVSLFVKMVEEGIRPDSVTFTSVLHACSHSGMVEEGLRIFGSMRDVHGIEPRIEHFGTLVDLLGRAGLVEEAEKFVYSMPIEPNGVIWGSLLNACVINRRLQMAKRVSNRVLLLGLEGVSSAFYVAMSNVYANAGRWEEVNRIRETMVEKGVRKAQGQSLVEAYSRKWAIAVFCNSKADLTDTEINFAHHQDSWLVVVESFHTS